MRRRTVKSLIGILLVALVMTGCKKTPADPDPTDQVPLAEPIAGPIALLDAPDDGVWDGPVAVIVENSPAARPQAGLGEADLVVETLAEAEVSRTLSFFWSIKSEKIGPVRSARQYFVNMAKAYGVPLAHAGGSQEAKEMLQATYRDRDLDGLSGSWRYFWRSSDRKAPHNFYTSSKLLGDAIVDRSVPTASVLTTPRAANRPESETTVKRVEVDWHRLHKVVWEWDGKTYRRFEHGGQPHMLEGGEQIGVPNLVFLDVQGVYRGSGLGWTLDLTQGGTATVLSGGQQWEGTWTLEPGGFQLEPAEGKVLPLLPGQVWAHLITTHSTVTFSEPE